MINLHFCILENRAFIPHVDKNVTEILNDKKLLDNIIKNVERFGPEFRHAGERALKIRLQPTIYTLAQALR